MNSYFDYINPKSIYIIFDKKNIPEGKLLEGPYKCVILDPRSPTQQSPTQQSPTQRSPTQQSTTHQSLNTRRYTPPKLSLESAGEWEKEHHHSLIKNTTFGMRFNYRSVPILSYT
jgi:hypothetical protein